MECTDKYDFDTPIDRTNTQSLKWDVAENELPMWVADMDFKTAPEIIEAVNKRAAHGVFGYSIIPESWNEAGGQEDITGILIKTGLYFAQELYHQCQA